MRQPKYLDPEILHRLYHYNPETGHISLRHANQKSKAGHIYTARYPDTYIKVPYLGSTVAAARAAWVMTTGEQPNIIDHINGVKHDNRLVNLRSVTISENCRNKPSVRMKNGTYISPEFA